MSVRFGHLISPPTYTPKDFESQNIVALGQLTTGDSPPEVYTCRGEVLRNGAFRAEVYQSFKPLLKIDIYEQAGRTMVRVPLLNLDALVSLDFSTVRPKGFQELLQDVLELRRQTEEHYKDQAQS